MTITRFRPLLSGEVDVNKLVFPVLASPKFDGIRCIMLDGKAVSRTLKPIRNTHIRNLLEENVNFGLDGELTVGSPTNPNCMQVTSSGVMSYGGKPDFTYFVFDHILTPRIKYSERYNNILDTIPHLPSFVTVVKHELITSLSELEAYEESIVSQGYEGIMIRSLLGQYKFGRSTTREGILLKMKRFVDEEATVIGFEERLHNANIADTDARGYTVRSQHQENMITMNTLGALIVCSDKWGVFSVGSGFDDLQRKEIWDNQASYLEKTITFKYQVHGVKDKPRAPIFRSFREDL